MGSGDDRFQWDPGDGSDTVDGQGGNDRLDFNGSNASEEVTFSASAGHAVLFRNVASITMDLDGLEHVNLRSLGGTDLTTVGDLGGTDLRLVDVDLDATAGGGDGAADTVIARGSDEADKVSFASPDGRPVVNGLGAQTRVTGGEATLDNFVAADARRRRHRHDDRRRHQPDPAPLRRRRRRRHRPLQRHFRTPT